MPISYFFEGLDESKATNEDTDLDIARAIASIPDDAVKSRIVTFIEDVSGAAVTRTGDCG